MADYLSPTVIQQSIPVADMTPLERLVLSNIFDAEPDGDAVYFCSSDGPNDTIWLPIEELQAAIDASVGLDSTAFAYVVERLAGDGADGTEIEIDFSGTSWEFIFQDIVRRSPTLAHVTAVTSFTCSKMRPDGFGGMAVLITADAIAGKSTEDIMCDLLDQAEHGPIGTAPGFGVHVLLELAEKSVRNELAQVVATNEKLATVEADAVTDADIRAGCAEIVERLDLREERDSAAFKAALAAIRHAEHRLSLNI